MSRELLQDIACALLAGAVIFILIGSYAAMFGGAS